MSQQWKGGPTDRYRFCTGRIEGAERRGVFWRSYAVFTDGAIVRGPWRLSVKAALSDAVRLGEAHS